MCLSLCLADIESRNKFLDRFNWHLSYDWLIHIHSVTWSYSCLIFFTNIKFWVGPQTGRLITVTITKTWSLTNYHGTKIYWVWTIIIRLYIYPERIIVQFLYKLVIGISFIPNLWLIPIPLILEQNRAG